MENFIFGLVVLLAATCSALKWKYTPPAVDVGSAVTIRCEASEDIEIYHKNVKIASGGKYALSKVGIETALKITNIAEAEAGRYECRSVADPTKKDNLDISITVSFPDEGKTYKKAIGQKGTIEFYVAGIPRPQIKYFTQAASGGAGKELVTISADGTVAATDPRFSVTKDKGHLVISNVKAGDAGAYIARTEVFGAEKDGKFTLQVGELPKITAPPAAAGYDLVSGVAATLPCSFATPPTTVEWFVTKAGGTRTKIAASDANFKKEGTNLKVVAPVKENEGDSLECEGTNEYGSKSAKTKINVVFVKPVVGAIVTPVKVVKGKDATIKCEATGNPSPVITWQKKNKDKFVDVPGQVKAALSSSFTITKAEAKDAGEYQCVAHLAAKKELKDTKMIKVEIQIPPTIVSATNLLVYPVGKELSKDLECKASGSPVPAVSFKKGGKLLPGAKQAAADATSVTMKIAYVANAAKDAGTIVCEARSPVGTVTKDIKIEMLDKPAAPMNLQATETENDFVMLAWNAVAGATGYVVSNKKGKVMDSPSTSSKVINLKGGETYSFHVQANNDAGLGPMSKVLTVTTLKFGMPSEPIPLTKGNPTEFTGTDAEFEWEAPAYNGGDKALEYEVQYCPQDSNGNYPKKDCKSVMTNTTSVSIPGLKAETSYHFHVFAKNARGTGKKAMQFSAKTGAGKAEPTKMAPKKKPTKKPKAEPSKGLSGGAIAGIIVAVVLILLIVIDLFCCFFNECGFTHCCYQACCAGKGKGKYSAADKDVEKHELKNNDGEAEPDVKTAPENEEKEPVVEKKTEDV